MKRTFTTLLIVGAVFWAGSVALAQPSGPAGPKGPGGRPQAWLSRADANGDGAISFEEFTAVAPNVPREGFDRRDRDGNGALSPADRPQGRRGGDSRSGRAGRFVKADKDSDIRLTFEELSAVFPDMTLEKFKHLDTNGDGALSPEDRRGGRDGGGRPGARFGRHRPEMMKHFRDADVDHDKRLTYGEIAASRPQFPEEMFKRFDRNADGVLSKEDRPQGREFRPSPEPGAAAPGRGKTGPGRGKRLVAKADADRNGSVTYDELAGQRPGFDRERFDELDTNGDGVLTPADAPRSGRGKAQGGQAGPGGPEMQGPKADGQGPRGARMRLREADSDGDKRITLDEAQKALPDVTAERFKKMDRNGDGVISPEDKRPD